MKFNNIRVIVFVVVFLEHSIRVRNVHHFTTRAWNYFDSPYSQKTIDLMIHTIRYTFNLDDEIKFLLAESRNDLSSIKIDDQVVIDFSSVGFITPFCLLGLINKCRMMFELSESKVIFRNVSDGLYLYLNRMKTFSVADQWIVLEGSYGHVIPWSESQYSTNLIEVTRIDGEYEEGSRDVLRVAGLLQNRGAEILSIWLRKDLFEIEEFVTVLSEISQNVFEHSGDFGYVALNKYQFSKSVRVNLSIIDGGLGIGNTIKPKLAEKKISLKNDSEYLSYAFDPGLPRSGGGGLKKVLDYVNRWNGTIFLRAENSCVFKGRDKITFEAWDNTPFFRGTHIGIWLEGH